MEPRDRDPAADALLDLDGQVFVIDAKGEYVVRFSVARIELTSERPHGLNYSLTLHGPDGSRLVGFDNAHAVRKSAARAGKVQLRTITSTRWMRFSLTGLGVQLRCSKISGPKSTGF